MQNSDEAYFKFCTTPLNKEVKLPSKLFYFDNLYLNENKLDDEIKLKIGQINQIKHFNTHTINFNNMFDENNDNSFETYNDDNIKKDNENLI